MPTREITLTEHLDDFISSGVEEGHYSDASEVVREGLRLLEQRHAEDRAKVEWLRGATQESIDSLERGEGNSFASIDELAGHIRELGRQASMAVEVRRHDSSGC